jgi:hypothetical protein
MEKKTLGRYSTLLTVTETGLGSLLHSFHLPFAGHFLSLNQGFLLAHALKNDEKKSFLLPTQISNIGAILKSLSPAGKKLTPMLAITAQGYLFSLGVLILGPTFWGLILGMTLLAIWAFAQPLLIYYLIFGNALFESYLFLLESLNKYLNINKDHLLFLLLGLVFVKIFLGWITIAALYFLSEKSQENWFLKLEKIAAHAGPAPRRNGWRGLTHPLFLVSLAVTIGFFVLAENQNNQLFWVIARPIAVAVLIHLIAAPLLFKLLSRKLLRQS